MHLPDTVSWALGLVSGLCSLTALQTWRYQAKSLLVDGSLVGVRSRAGNTNHRRERASRTFLALELLERVPTLASRFFVQRRTRQDGRGRNL